MNYASGEPVQLGDTVSLDGRAGRVVAIIEDDQFGTAYPRTDWRYLNNGALIEFQEFGLIHYPTIEADIILVLRDRPAGDDVKSSKSPERDS